MARLFVGNFDFEHQLKGEALTLPAHLRRRNAELAFVWLALAADGDFVLTDAKPDAEFVESLHRRGLPRVNFVTPRDALPAGLELCPWGWTRELREWGTQRGCMVDAPDDNAIVLANSRRFSFRCEREWDVAIPAAAEFLDVDSLRPHLNAVCKAETRWVIKAEFGMSARERFLGQGAFLSPNNIHWIDKRLSAGQRLYFEPWVEKISEAGLQFSVPRTGEPEFIGCTELLTDPRGQYRGSRWHPQLAGEWSREIEYGLRVCREVQPSGYFGPLGIDAMRYRDAGGAVRSRPLQDVNARWTMGRLASACRRFVPTGCEVSMLHVASNESPPIISDEEYIKLLPEYAIDLTGAQEALLNQVYLVWRNPLPAGKGGGVAAG